MKTRTLSIMRWGPFLLFSPISIIFFPLHVAASTSNFFLFRWSSYFFLFADDDRRKIYYRRWANTERPNSAGSEIQKSTQKYNFLRNHALNFQGTRNRSIIPASPWTATSEEESLLRWIPPRGTIASTSDIPPRTKDERARRRKWGRCQRCRTRRTAGRLHRLAERMMPESVQ